MSVLSSSRSFAALAVPLLVSAVAFGPLPAQGSVSLPPAQTARVEVMRARTGNVPDIPQPPRAVLYQGPSDAFTPVPQGGPGLPQPNSPPSVPAAAGGVGLAAPCDFRFFMNNAVSPSAALLSAGTGEPNVGVHGDAALFAGNWYAGLSTDSGMTWSSLNPFTRFPALDGGFCCDQRVLHVPNPGLTIWLLEYGYSATTQAGSLRIAFSRNQTDLRNGVFFYFDLSPAVFGQSGRFLDFSDIAYSNGNLYGSAIIGTPPNLPAGLLLWRANLLDVWDLGGVGLQFYTSAALGGFGSYRFAQGATDPMYFAAHTSTTNLRLYSWADGSNSAAFFDRTVAPWSTTPTPAAGPDGRDWTGFAYTVNAVLSGFARFGEVGFLWTSGAVAGRPQTFVRVARFRTSDLALIGQDDIWNGSLAFHFPTCAVSAGGDVGGTIAYGGGGAGGSYPSSAAFLVDGCSPNWAPLTNVTFAAGARGPGSNRWGDYLGAGRHSTVTTTFVGGGFALDASGNAVPRFVWFGRQSEEPGWVDADFAATDLAAATPLVAALTVQQTDRFFRKDGTTPFSRSYPPRQRLQVTAPLRAQSGAGAQFQFSHWVYQGVQQPLGQRSLDVGDLGTGPRTVVAQARYEAIKTIVVDTTPVTAVPIAMQPTDLLGRGNGTTAFQREYLAATRLGLQAPAQSGSNLFRYWIVNGVPQTPSQTNIFFDLNSDTVAIADYGAVAGLGTDWRDVSAASPVQPSGRFGHGMVHDAGRGRIVLFGGTSGSAETWELDGPTWTQLSPATSPSARYGHAMAYDPIGQQTLLFGGTAGTQETWSFDGATWTQLATATLPPARQDAAMAFHGGSGRMVMFGGTSGFTTRADTWEFDGTDWVQATPASNPPMLSSPSMVYDSLRDRIVLIGGVTTTSVVFDTWEWDGTDWSHATPANSPAGRYSTPLAFDPLRGRAVLYSGARGFLAPLPDTWEWDGLDWTQRFTTGLPIAREDHGLVYDETHHRVVMFGGFVRPFTSRNDTWEYTFDCEPIGEGHIGGGLPLTCTSRPQIGHNFCVQFPNSLSVGALFLGFSPPLRPPLPLAPPLACNLGFLWVLPDFVRNVNGDPGTTCIPIPDDASLVGAFVVLQGVALNSAQCIDLTDAMVMVVQP